MTSVHHRRTDRDVGFSTQRFRKTVTDLEAKLPLGAFHKEAVAFPLAQEKSLSSFWQRIEVLVHFLVTDKYLSLFLSDAALATSTARVVLAFLQYWHSFGTWFPEEKAHVRGVDMFIAISLRVLPRQERLLADLFSAHAIDFMVAALSDSANLRSHDHYGVQYALYVALHGSRPVLAHQLASSVWSGGVYQCLAKLAAEPIWDSDSDAAHDRGKRRFWALQCMHECHDVLHACGMPVSATADQPALLNHALRAVLTDPKFEDGCSAAVRAATSFTPWIMEHDLDACDKWMKELYDDSLGVMACNALSLLEILTSRYECPQLDDQRSSNVLVFLCNAFKAACCRCKHREEQVCDTRLLELFKGRTPAGKSFGSYLLAPSSLKNDHIFRSVTQLASDLRTVLSSLKGESLLAVEIRNFLGDVRWRRTLCGNAACKTSLPALKKCARCETISYCGKECQAADWPQHKTACKKS
eukprot:TRINITY_DN3045_c0_g3_i1.p1 TRINITY_DN3045_c0_g3~~TRINITY_DN3045_c0_g3_i1.p1  ORF type:complete len:470 (+),score=55.91 TRINITY_DN3045_c0_g3_i1:119-1528(+)